MDLAGWWRWRGQRRGKQLYGTGRFLFVPAAHSTKLYIWNASSTNDEQPVLLVRIWCCIGSYFLFFVKYSQHNLLCSRRAVEHISPESINLFQPLDGCHGSVKPHYKQLELYALPSPLNNRAEVTNIHKSSNVELMSSLIGKIRAWGISAGFMLGQGHWGLQRSTSAQNCLRVSSSCTDRVRRAPAWTFMLWADPLAGAAGQGFFRTAPRWLWAQSSAACVSAALKRKLRWDNWLQNSRLLMLVLPRF